MIPTTRWALRVWFACLAFAGVVSAHGLTFFLAAPHGHARRGLLELTGHGSWSTVQILAALGVAAAVGGSLRSFVRSPGPETSRLRDYRTSVGKLALLQTVAYIGVEASERLNVGASLFDVLTDRLLLAGIVAQIVVAAFACLVLFFLSRVVQRLLASVRVSFGRVSKLTAVGLSPVCRFTDLSRSPWSLRGPPALARI